jgi:DsbC/DsbD-like thiol-disulfide interchange protein
MDGGHGERRSRHRGISVPPCSSRWCSLLFFAVFYSLLFAVSIGAQSTPETHAKIQLVSAEKSIHIGSSFWVGIFFQLDPGWHIYWQNPGDSGEPPKIEWQLPPGFRAGAIRWPRPIPLGSASVRDYGYEGEVLLMAAIQPPSSFTRKSPVAVAATVKYVVCREICIPGKANMTLTIPVNPHATLEPSEWRELFRTTRTQLPKPLPSTWKVSAKSEGDHLILSLEGAGSARELMFFPLDPGVIQNAAAQTLELDNKGLRLTLKKSEQLVKPVSTLRGVIVLDQYRAYEIAVPVKSS